MIHKWSLHEIYMITVKMKYTWHFSILTVVGAAILMISLLQHSLYQSSIGNQHISFQMKWVHFPIMYIFVKSVT